MGNAHPTCVALIACVAFLRLSHESVIDDPLAADFVGSEQQGFADQFLALGESKCLGVGAPALLDNLADDWQPLWKIEITFEADNFVGLINQSLFDFQFAVFVQRVWRLSHKYLPGRRLSGDGH